MIHAAKDVDDLRIPPGNRLERLVGDRRGQHSIRVNAQWHICFVGRGAHTAFLVAAARPDLVDRLVMLEGHVAGSDDPEGAARLGRYFAKRGMFTDADKDELSGSEVPRRPRRAAECSGTVRATSSGDRSGTTRPAGCGLPLSTFPGGPRPGGRHCL